VSFIELSRSKHRVPVNRNMTHNNASPLDLMKHAILLDELTLSLEAVVLLTGENNKSDIRAVYRTFLM
jgi:hypothetical protein